MRNLLVLVAALVLVLVFIYKPERRWPPGMMINSDPVVGRLTHGPVWVKGDYTITGQASYKVRARVLCVNHQFSDSAHDISPYDYLLGWRRMSEQGMLDKFTIYDFWRRQVQISWKGPAPMTETETFSSLGNMHLIPSNDTVRSALGKARPGDIVNLEGWFVDVTKPGGWEMRTGITELTGPHACKVVYVERFSIEPPVGTVR